MSREPQVRRHEPGLDGLRAVAVAAVLCFHSGFGWARGGYLGVSVFFTLSGFLITGLLVDEASRSGRVALGSFWSRRFRRLLPAASLALLLVAATLPWYDAAHRAAQARGDVLAALLHVANWRFVLSGRSYADLFVSGPSPVLHFWSLAVEEQFYVVAPLVVAAVAWWAGRRGRRVTGPLAVALVVLLAASVLSALLTRSQDLGYYGTHIRAAEFLVGGLCALAVRAVHGREVRSRAWRAVPGAVGAVALLLFAWWAHSVDQSDAWLYRGGFAALALVWCGLLAGALGPGPVRRVLSWAPLRSAGTLSYGIYLFHWPVFLLLTESRTGLGPVLLFAVRVAAATALAGLSYHVVEQPVRTRRWRMAGARGAAALTLAMVAVAGVAVVQAAHSRPAVANEQLDAPDEVTHLGGAGGAGGGAAGAAIDVVAPEPVDVVVLGAPVSTPVLGRTVAAGFAPARLVDLTRAGCPVFTPTDGCEPVQRTVAAFLSSGGAPAAVVLSVGADEHRAEAAAEAVAKAGGDEAVVRYWDDQSARVRTVITGLRAAVPAATPVYVLDLQLDVTKDFLSKQVETASVEAGEVVTADGGTISPLVGTAIARARAGAASQRLRVVVIGDSTSYGVAVELDRQAGERYDVVWAGFRNCPLVPLDRLRWWPGVEFDMEGCVAAQRRWPQVIADARPDVLVIAESLPELSDQDAGDGRWVAVGDPRFAAAHDAAVGALIDAVRPYGTEVLFADAAHGPSVLPDRVAAWNAMIDAWAARWPQIQVVPWGAWVEAAEADAGRSLRPDAIHLDDATEATAVAEVYLPVLEQIRVQRRAEGSFPAVAAPSERSGS